jgi:ubiquitin C-terminal hydrolase
MNLNDTHDMIILLLRALHEDLNRVKDSLSLNLDFSEKSEKETDEQAADRWWNNFLQRENSIITDLFYGQFKITMKCPDCKNIQSTYEPFLTLALPIGEKSDSRARFKIFLNDFKYEFYQIELIEVDKFTSVKNLKEKVKENFYFKKKEFDVVLLKDKEVIKVLPEDELIYDYVFQRIDFTQEVFTDWELIVLEVEQSSESKNKGENVTFYICPFNLIKETYLYYLTYETKNFLCYPKAISISKKCKLKDLYIQVFRYFRRIMENIEKKTFQKFYKNILDDKFVRLEFDFYFRDIENKTLKESNELKELMETKENENENENEMSNLENEEKEKDKEKEKDEYYTKKYKEPFNLYLSNNIPISQSYFSSTPKCEFCDSHCSSCKIQNDENTTIYEFFARQKIEREFIIHADFSLFKSNFRRFYFENTDIDDPLINCRGDISIYECINQFQKESKIEKPKENDMDKVKDNDKENHFYCKYCRKNLKGLKRMQIWRCPNILIIQLKRFKMKVASLMELVHNRKNETHIDFQIYLDLSKNVLGTDKENAEYELISVCNHTGKMNAGKYSTIKKGIQDENWYEFIDEEFKEINEEDLSNPNAYLLVFKKLEKKDEEKNNEENDINNDNNNNKNQGLIKLEM